MYKIYAAAITPFAGDDKPDTVSMEKMLRRLYRHGLDGAFIFGTMGEWGQLDSEERAAYLECACGVSSEEKRELLAGISANSLHMTLKTMEESMRFPCDSFVVMLPGMRTSQVDPVTYFHTVCSESDRPVYFYHAPANNNLQLTSRQIAAIADHPRCAGIKNSAGNMSLRKELLLLKRSNPSLRLLEGNEWAVDEALMLGCDGAVCGIGALAAKPLARLAKAAAAGDWKLAQEIQFELLPLFKAVYGTTSWLGQKYALKALGVISSAQCRIQPETMLTDARRSEIEEYINNNRSFLE